MIEAYYRVFMKRLEGELSCAESANNKSEINLLNKMIYSFERHHETFLTYQAATKQESKGETLTR